MRVYRCRRRCLSLYIVSRIFSFHKGIDHTAVEQFNHPSMMKHFPGFIRRDVLLNTKNPDIDEVRILVYWESKQAYYRFEGSPEHIQMHKDKSHPHHQKPEGLIGMRKEEFSLIQSEVYEVKKDL